MFAAALGSGEIAVIILVVILLFGATKLPQLARSLGASAREFRKGVEDGSDEDLDDGTKGTKEAPATGVAEGADESAGEKPADESAEA